jgi:rare lipoprotein A (peptidoglycan hydrolase)
MRAVVIGLVILMTAPVGQSELEPVSKKKLTRPTRLPAPKPSPPKPKPYQVGLASWYGAHHHGHSTANGESYDMFQLTAAHRRLPLGSLVRVTHLTTHRSVVVRINDRGPSRDGLIIDLSYAAARQLGVLRRGLARVRLDVVEKPQLEAASRLPSE